MKPLYTVPLVRARVFSISVSEGNQGGGAKHGYELLGDGVPIDGSNVIFYGYESENIVRYYSWLSQNMGGLLDLSYEEKRVLSALLGILI